MVEKSPSRSTACRVFPSRRYWVTAIVAYFFALGVPIIAWVSVPVENFHVKWTVALCGLLVGGPMLWKGRAVLLGGFALRVDDVGVASNVADWQGQLYWSEIDSVRIVDTANWGPVLEIFVVDRDNVLQRFGWGFRKTWMYNRSSKTPFATLLRFLDAPGDGVKSAIETAHEQWRRKQRELSKRESDALT